MVSSPYSLRSPEQVAMEYSGNKQRIAQAIQMGLLDPTTGALAGMFIDKMRSAQAEEGAPQSTVAQRIFQPQPAPQVGAPQPQAGQGAPQPQAAQGAPHPAMPASNTAPHLAGGGIASLPLPDSMFQEPNNGGYAGGGIIAFGDGGDTSDDYERSLHKPGEISALLNYIGKGLYGVATYNPAKAQYDATHPTPARPVAPAPARPVAPAPARPAAPAPTPAPAPAPAPTIAMPSAPTPYDAWAAATVQQESYGDYTAHNKSGAMGKYQLMPPTATALAARAGVPYRPDLLTSDTPEARQYQDTLGSMAQQEAWQYSKGDPAKASAYYYAGPTAKLQGQTDTQKYVGDVLGRLNGPGTGVIPGGVGPNSVPTAAQVNPTQVTQAAASTALPIVMRANAAGQGSAPRMSQDTLTAPVSNATIGAALQPTMTMQGASQALNALAPLKQQYQNQMYDAIQKQLSPEGQKQAKDQALWSALADVGANMASTPGGFLRGLSAGLGKGGQDAAQARKDMQAQQMELVKQAAALESAQNTEAFNRATTAQNVASSTQGHALTGSTQASNAQNQQAGITQRGGEITTNGVVGLVTPQTQLVGANLNGSNQIIATTANDQIRLQQLQEAARKVADTNTLAEFKALPLAQQVQLKDPAAYQAWYTQTFNKHYANVSAQMGYSGVGGLASIAPPAVGTSVTPGFTVGDPTSGVDTGASSVQ